MPYKIIDSRTGALSTRSSYLFREDAERDITAWQDRHDRGGRPDITLDKLLHMKVVEDDRL